MKKFVIIIFLLLTVSLSACNSKEQVTIITPQGAPTLAQIYMQNTDDYDVDIVNGPDGLVSAFGSGSHDYIFAPTNLGAKMYNGGSDYKFIAAITFGNYFIVTSTLEDFNLNNLNNKDIVCFGKNATSDIVLQYVLKENQINVNITYVDSLEMANALLIKDSNTIILSAEPALSVLKTKVSNIKTIDLQEEYKKITGKNSYPQAGVFAKTSLSDKEINQFLEDLENSIEKVNSNVEDSSKLAVELELGFPENVLISAIPNSHIDFMPASEVKEDLLKYFGIILEMNPVLIGNNYPDDDFYY